MENVRFIGFPEPLPREFRCDAPAPIFRRHFNVEDGLVSASVRVCALGVGKFYLNEKTLTEDIFITPFGTYGKTLWYNEYDITDKLCKGENIIAVALGNGFYNESLTTCWDCNKAKWRSDPKFYFDLKIEYSDRTEHILSDTEWVCTRDSSPYRFNQWRMGEIYDYTCDADWAKKDFNDSFWVSAAYAEYPGGVMRKNPAEPIRECRIYECCEMFKNPNGDWVFDFGQNMSGYVRIKTKQPKGTKLHIIYAEQLNEDSCRKDNKLSEFYWNGETQFNTIIAGEKEVDYRPDFSYYGFRYVIVNGFEGTPSPSDIQAIFVHQDVEINGHFRCSDELLNSIYNLSRISTLSNLFNMPTDCPTREKMGYSNDAQASCEQMIQNYELKKFFEKWVQDIVDCQREDGEIPLIAPAWDTWGYDWGTGPVSTGVLFEIPLRLYQYSGDCTMLCELYPRLVKHLEFLESKRGEDGLICYGLSDWGGPWPLDDAPTPLSLICTALYIKLCKITMLSASLSGKNTEAEVLKEKIEKERKLFDRSFMSENGECAIEEQTALALIISNGLYTDLEPLKKQFIRCIEKYDYHFHVGMLGMQYMLPALDICGLNEVGYRLLTASGTPSYRSWLEDGATSLHELFGETMSCNHHMYSCVISWYHNVILGIKYELATAKTKTIVIKPSFLSKLSFATGSYKTDYGTVAVSWKRTENSGVQINIEIPDGLNAKLILCEKEQDIKAGKHSFSVKEI